MQPYCKHYKLPTDDSRLVQPLACPCDVTCNCHGISGPCETAHVCGGCEHIFLGKKGACPKCNARQILEQIYYDFTCSCGIQVIGDPAHGLCSACEGTLSKSVLFTGKGFLIKDSGFDRLATNNKYTAVWIEEVDVINCT